MKKSSMIFMLVVLLAILITGCTNFLPVNNIENPISSLELVTLTPAPTSDTALTAEPTAEPSAPTVTDEPTAEPSAPTVTDEPTAEPSAPTVTDEPTAEPSAPTVTDEPTAEPSAPTVTDEPTAEPSAPTVTDEPTPTPTPEPTPTPTKKPTPTPTKKPTPTPTKKPTPTPTKKPTPTPTPTPKPTPTSLFEGAGTKNNPYLIENLTDLKNLQKVINKSGYYFRQTADIDCSSVDKWTSIGSNDEGEIFRHNYDGDGYKISNIRLDENSEGVALFAVAEDAHFENINIVNAWTEDNYITYENNTGKYPGSGGSTAALVGRAIGCTFENCTATVDFKSSNSGTGGLVGYVEIKENQDDLMVDCSVKGIITGGGNIGGLIGSISSHCVGEDFAPDGALDIYIKDCYTDVEIYQFVISIERAKIGGLVGFANLVKIEKCHSEGIIKVLGGDVAGLVGYTLYATEITRCSADVEVTCELESHYGGVSAGGLIGRMNSYAIVHDCYATGNVNVPYAEWSPCRDSTPRNGGPNINYYNPAGSLIGSIVATRPYSDYHKIEVWNCYATGIVNAPNICEDKRVYCHGALVGLVLDNYTYSYIIDKTKKDQSDWAGFSDNNILRFENNYNLEELRTYFSPVNDYKYTGMSGLSGAVYSEMPKHEYVEIITETQLKDESTFEGWDFENIWIMGENGPELR